MIVKTEKELTTLTQHEMLEYTEEYVDMLESEENLSEREQTQLSLLRQVLRIQRLHEGQAIVAAAREKRIAQHTASKHKRWDWSIAAIILVMIALAGIKSGWFG